jgi:hypothetical protein
MALKTYEGKVCDAILRLLEARAGAKREKLWHPEATADNEVELTFELAGRFYAMEHTTIEPFEDFMRLNAQAEQHFEPIRRACDNLGGGDVLELELPARCLQDLDKATRATAQGALIKHIQTIAATLPRRRYSDYIGADKPVTIADVPFAFRVFRFENLGIEPRLQIKHIAPDLEKERPERMARACEDKFPKLHRWKDKGATTILVFEDTDIQLTNPATVAEAFLPIANNRKDVPDETYLVASCMTPWQAWPILVDTKSYFDLAKTGRAQNVPFEEAALSWITQKRGA